MWAQRNAAKRLGRVRMRSFQMGEEAGRYGWIRERTTTAAAHETMGNAAAKIQRLEPVAAATKGSRNPASQSAGQTLLTPRSKRIHAPRWCIGKCMKIAIQTQNAREQTIPNQPIVFAISLRLMVA
jgi:hypothetical protein